jgi:hypothetical protein
VVASSQSGASDEAILGLNYQLMSLDERAEDDRIWAEILAVDEAYQQSISHEFDVTPRIPHTDRPDPQAEEHRAQVVLNQRARGF